MTSHIKYVPLRPKTCNYKLNGCGRDTYIHKPSSYKSNYPSTKTRV